MNKYWKNKWDKALRSGKYKQTRTGALRSHQNSFCCLGVLCDVVINSPTGKKLGLKWEQETKGDTYSIFKGKKNITQGDETLPRVIMDIVGMESHSGNLNEPYKNQKSLTDLNDDTKARFPEIANIVEKEF